MSDPNNLNNNPENTMSQKAYDGLLNALSYEQHMQQLESAESQAHEFSDQIIEGLKDNPGQQLEKLEISADILNHAAFQHVISDKLDEYLPRLNFAQFDDNRKAYNTEFNQSTGSGFDDLYEKAGDISLYKDAHDDLVIYVKSHGEQPDDRPGPQLQGSVARKISISSKDGQLIVREQEGRYTGFPDHQQFDFIPAEKSGGEGSSSLIEETYAADGSKTSRHAYSTALHKFDNGQVDTFLKAPVIFDLYNDKNNCVEETEVTRVDDTHARVRILEQDKFGDNRKLYNEIEPLNDPRYLVLNGDSGERTSKMHEA